MYLLQLHSSHGSEAIATQPVTHQPYIHQINSGEKIGVKPSSPLQDTLAYLIDLN